jgi:methyltransferase (TIGR00027 family)
MSETPVRGVGDTAFLVAAYRAEERLRPKPLFEDPLAERLAGERGKAIAAAVPFRASMGRWTVQLRTCIIDDFVRWAIGQGIETVLSLGAGLDTRPYRMELPRALRWVEVDFPEVLDYKEAALAGERPRCALERVRLDLSQSEARRKLLGETAQASRNILVLTEGVIPYLTENDVGALADDLRAHPSYRFWIADYLSPEAYSYRRRAGMVAFLKNAPFRFEPADYFGFFQVHGFHPKVIRYYIDEAKKVGRPPPLPLWMRLIAKIFRFGRQFSGYVMFEPGEKT